MIRDIGKRHTVLKILKFTWIGSSLIVIVFHALHIRAHILFLKITICGALCWNDQFSGPKGVKEDRRECMRRLSGKVRRGTEGEKKVEREGWSEESKK